MSKLKANDVSKHYSDFSLDDVDLVVGDNETVGILGSNGAGKSTLMEILTGQESRDKGSVEVLETDPEEDSSGLQERIGILPEREDPPSFLTGDEYIEFVSDIRTDEESEKLIEKVGLDNTSLEKQTRSLSKGQRQKLMIVQAFSHNPELVFIDEPFINLDPGAQEDVKEIFKEHSEEGGSMVISTHLISLAEEVCDRVIFLEEGQKVEEASADQDLKKQFLEAQNR